MKKLLACVCVLVMMLPCSSLAITEAEQYLGIDLSTMTVEELHEIIETSDYVIDLMEQLKAQAQELIESSGKPDYASMSLSDAVLAIGQNTKESGWQISSCVVDPDVVWVDVERNNEWFDDEFMLVGAIRFAIEYMQEAFKLNNVPQLYFRFKEKGRNNNGQQIDMTTITMRVTKEKAEVLDLDYFHEWAVTKQLAFLNAINGYSLYKDYKAIAK